MVVVSRAGPAGEPSVVSEFQAQKNPPQWTGSSERQNRRLGIYCSLVRL